MSGAIEAMQGGMSASVPGRFSVMDRRQLLVLLDLGALAAPLAPLAASVCRHLSTKTIRAILAGAVVLLLSMLTAAEGPVASDQPTLFIGPLVEPTLMRIVPYPDQTHPPLGVASGVPYASCYRVGRCSVNDLYRFRDRPNWLTRLAPEAPPESVAWPPSVQYRWFLVPVTPEENILPKYRTASQIRDEYRDVGRPIDVPD